MRRRSRGTSPGPPGPSGRARRRARGAPRRRRTRSRRRSSRSPSRARCARRGSRSRRGWRSGGASEQRQRGVTSDHAATAFGPRSPFCHASQIRTTSSGVRASSAGRRGCARPRAAWRGPGADGAFARPRRGSPRPPRCASRRLEVDLVERVGLGVVIRRGRRASPGRRRVRHRPSSRKSKLSVPRIASRRAGRAERAGRLERARRPGVQIRCARS
jgi:hypothetical protein